MPHRPGVSRVDVPGRRRPHGFRRIAHQIIEKTALDDQVGPDAPRVVLLIPTRGSVTLANRPGGQYHRIQSGIHVALWRAGHHPVPRRSYDRCQALEVDVDPGRWIDDALVILVDDARSTRALGRSGGPRGRQLAVLVDRGRSEPAAARRIMWATFRPAQRAQHAVAGASTTAVTAW